MCTLAGTRPPSRRADRYVSWLELGSLDDVDHIGHCQECPLGTSFESVVDWNSDAKIPDSMTAALKYDNDILTIKSWKKWHLPCFPCQEGYFKNNKGLNECQPCKDQQHALYTRTAVYIRKVFPIATLNVQDSSELRYAYLPTDLRAWSFSDRRASGRP